MEIKSTIKRVLLSVGIGAIATILLLGCEKNPTSSESNLVTVQGKVVGDNPSNATAGIRDARISTARMNQAGDLEIINKDFATTDASGSFSIQLESQNSDPLVIVATKNSSEWEALVPGLTEMDSRNFHMDINFESKAETEVYRQLIKTGYNSQISLSMLREYIGPEEARMIRKGSWHLFRFIQKFLEYAHALERTRVYAAELDSTYFVHIRRNFLVSFSDDSTVVDSIMANFLMDESTVDSLLKISQSNMKDDHEEWNEKSWDDDYDSDYADEYSNDENSLKIRTFPNSHRFIPDSGLVAIKIQYGFFTDSTSRENLVAAISDSTVLSRSQIQDALMYSGFGHGDKWDQDDDHGDDDHDDQEQRPDSFHVELEMHSSISLADSTLQLVDSLKTLLENDSTVTGDTEIWFSVKKMDGEINLSQQTNIDLSTEQMALWTTIQNAVRLEVESADAEWVSVKIELKIEEYGGWEKGHHSVQIQTFG